MPATSFGDWLVREMETRGWTNSELARRTGLVQSTISMIASGQKTPSAQTCVAVARAFEMPAAHVLRRAGIMPPAPPEAENEEEVMFIFRQLDPDSQEMILAMLRGALKKTGEPKES